MSKDRITEVIEDLEQVLIAFFRKHKITHDEYRAATDLIIASIKAGEESLLFDVFLEAEATDIGNIDRPGSPEAIEGPFYLPNAPVLQRPYVMPQRPDEQGDIMFFHGKVCNVAGAPLANARLELWHADAEGLYSNIHPSVPPWNLRACFHTDENGDYEVKTIVPPPYEIPKNGPTGQVLTALGRHFYRPAHLHVKVEHAHHKSMTSQLYFEGGEYIDNDVANAVRDGLITTLERIDDKVEAEQRGLNAPFFKVRYDFFLK